MAYINSTADHHSSSRMSIPELSNGLPVSQSQSKSPSPSRSRSPSPSPSQSPSQSGVNRQLLNGQDLDGLETAQSRVKEELENGSYVPPRPCLKARMVQSLPSAKGNSLQDRAGIASEMKRVFASTHEPSQGWTNQNGTDIPTATGLDIEAGSRASGKEQEREALQTNSTKGKNGCPHSGQFPPNVTPKRVLGVRRAPDGTYEYAVECEKEGFPAVYCINPHQSVWGLGRLMLDFYEKNLKLNPKPKPKLRTVIPSINPFLRAETLKTVAAKLAQEHEKQKQKQEQEQQQEQEQEQEQEQRPGSEVKSASRPLATTASMTGLLINGLLPSQYAIQQCLSRTTTGGTTGSTNGATLQSYATAPLTLTTTNRTTPMMDSLAGESSMQQCLLPTQMEQERDMSRGLPFQDQDVRSLTVAGIAGKSQ